MIRKFFTYLVGAIVAAVAGAAVYIPVALLDGWVMSILWRWFMVAAFGLPALSVVMAIGVCICIHSFISTVNNCKQEKQEWPQILAGLLRPFIFLLLGALWRCFL